MSTECSPRDLAEIAAKAIIARDPEGDQFPDADMPAFVTALAMGWPAATLKVYVEAEEEVERLRAEVERLRGDFRWILDGLHSRKGTECEGMLSMREKLQMIKNAAPATERVEP